MSKNEKKGKENDVLQTGKETLKAGSEAVKNQISLLPFNNLMEEKIPTATRDKYPILNKLIPLANFIFTGVAILLLILIIAIAAGGGSNPKALAKQTVELSKQTLSVVSNPVKYASFAKKYAALEKKVGKLSARKKAIYEKEVNRLAPSLFDLFF